MPDTAGSRAGAQASRMIVRKSNHHETSRLCDEQARPIISPQLRPPEAPAHPGSSVRKFHLLVKSCRRELAGCGSLLA